ncbi:hypothetical protein [Staphylococcus aureus]|uniref:hypothetical protein n=1 Tax=Staphylococcus aureus TaxID=1280 RepID=UPI001F22D330|nr:hypothetical protein [Staphylococcus aureus]
MGGKSSIFHPKKTKIEDIFHGCLRFFGSKGTNGSAPVIFSIKMVSIAIFGSQEWLNNAV